MTVFYYVAVPHFSSQTNFLWKTQNQPLWKHVFFSTLQLYSLVSFYKENKNKEQPAPFKIMVAHMLKFWFKTIDSKQKTQKVQKDEKLAFENNR